MLQLTAATNQAKNSLSRRHGFSPYQWVLGRDIRLPATLMDEEEVARIGAQSLAVGLRHASPSSKPRILRPSVVPSSGRSGLLVGRFPLGLSSSTMTGAPKNKVGVELLESSARRAPGLLAEPPSPEHLSRAHDDELHQWNVVGQEETLMDTMPPEPASSN